MSKGNFAIANGALAWFLNKNHHLSANFLSRALYVRDPGEYLPSNEQKAFLYKTVAYQSLKRKDRYPAGSKKKAEFANTFNRDEADASYAIDGFSAEMTHKRVIIRDRYDFKADYNYSAAAVAVNACTWLQNRGYLVPFDLRIHLK